MSKTRFRLPPPRAYISLAVSIAVGATAAWLHVPLAWTLGPLIATAVMSVCGQPVFAPLSGRRFGQLVIGTSTGLSVTAAVLASIVAFLPLIVVTSLVAVLFSAGVSVFFAHFARLDRKTAYFAMVPGGLSEMANIASMVGAHAEPIAVSQALRVALLVLIMPQLIVSLGIHGNVEDLPVQGNLTLVTLLTALGCGAVGIGVAWLLRFNNPWMIGALMGASAATAAGLLHGLMPYWLFATGQMMMGLSIGARFRREMVMRLPRLFAISALHTLALAAMLLAVAFVVSSFTSLDFASAALSTSPGGTSEMAVTAQTLHLSVGLVTAFHVVRAFVVNGFATRFYTLFERIGLFDRIERWAAPLIGSSRHDGR
ncbi:MAG: AbrB family transcriptional regulator [Xanthobacteraceae bacterium]|nr:AbrB family transcriptional regulator [Xanthobacteraceae bacterium]